MSTLHNNAKKNEIASVVLMPGDPQRAKMIAKKYLEDVVLVNEVRSMYCYTGTYKGVRVSVMASGMGAPSMGIYSYELFHFYEVDRIIRIGSAGSYDPELHLGDVLLAASVYSESTYAKVQNGCVDKILYPSIELNRKIVKGSVKTGVSIKLGRLHSCDVFYQEDGDTYNQRLYEEKRCQAVEMEAFALFHNANVLKKEAACLVTISDSYTTKEKMTTKDRQNSFTKMIEVGLESVIL